MTAARAKLRNLRIDEFSLVDKACQEPAVAVILKRDPKAVAKSDPEAAAVAAPASTYEVPAAALAAFLASDAGRAAMQAALEPITPQETAMTTDADRIKTLEAELAKAQNLAAMSDAQKAHLAKLSGDAAGVFLAKSAGERATEVAALTEVVYKAANGDVFTKADDQRMVTAIKRADESDAKVATVELTKRASQIFKTGKGTPDVHAAILGAVEKHITDETLRAKAIEVLKANDHAGAGAYKLVGYAGEGPDAESAIAKVAQAISKRAADKGESTEAATEWLVDNDREFNDLRKQAQDERDAMRRARA